MPVAIPEGAMLTVLSDSVAGASSLSPWLKLALLLLLVNQLAIISTTVYLHRYTAHKAISLHPSVAFAFRMIIWITTGIKRRQWAAVHRAHHASVDRVRDDRRPGDPHSPVLLGLRTVQLHNPELYTRAAQDPTIMAYASDLPPDYWDRRLFDKPYLGTGIGTAWLCALAAHWLGSLWLGLVVGFGLAVIHTVVYLMENAFVNGFGHYYGYVRDNREGARHAGNIWWAALFIGGEPLHNNHHGDPNDGRLAWSRTEWLVDTGSWVIWWLQRLGLAKFKPRPSKLGRPIIMRTGEASRYRRALRNTEAQERRASQAAA